MSWSTSKRTARRAEFARGWRTHHPFVLLAAIGLALLIFLPLTWLIADGAYVAIPEDRLLREGGDDAVHISYAVSLLKRHGPQELPVYLIGGSAMRESIVSEDALAHELATKTGVMVEVHSLTGNSLTFADDLAIIKNLPPSRGIVVIGVSLERFARPTDDSASALRSDLLLPSSSSLSSGFLGDSAKADTSPSSGLTSLTLLPGLVRYGVTYLNDHYADLLRVRWPRTQFVVHRYQRESSWSLARKRATITAWAQSAGKSGGAFDQTFRSTSRALAMEVTAARAKGFTVLLVEQPFDLRPAGHQLDRVRNEYKSFCHSLTRQDRGVSYVDFSRRAGLASADFHDLSHLIASGWQKYQRQLAATLAAPLDCLVATRQRTLVASTAHAGSEVCAALSSGSVAAQ